VSNEALDKPGEAVCGTRNNSIASYESFNEKGTVMFRRLLLSGVGALALTVSLVLPGEVHARGMGGGMHSGFRTGMMTPGFRGGFGRFNNGFFNPRFNTRFNNGFFSPRFTTPFNNGFTTPFNNGFTTPFNNGTFFNPGFRFSTGMFFDPRF
jgi:hypothetical protein